MNGSLKISDDRPRALWRYPLVKTDDYVECRMKNTPLELFICPRTDSCPYQCLQKIDQRQREEYVREQQMKMLIKIERISQTNGNNGRKK